MPGIDPAFPVKRPISVWNRPLKADFKGLFGALKRGALHGFTGQWAELGSDVVDAVAALGIDSRDAPQLGWLLIRRSLLAAMAELAREAAPLAGETMKETLNPLSDQLDEQIEKEEVTIDRAFFERPRELLLLASLEKPFIEWLVAYGLKSAAAASVARRLPSYFVAALHGEWGRSPGTYEPVREAVDTPFTQAAERERAWGRYSALLDRQVDEPMFGEAFGLRQVYVPLRAFYVLESRRDQAGGFIKGVVNASDEGKEPRVAVDLARTIDSWLESKNRHDGYRVISGGPGSGKSSFVRMYAAGLARQGRERVLFVPLHQINVSGALVDAIGEYVRMADLLPANPLDPEMGEDRLFVILDGLDELSLQGRVGADAARDFVREVMKVVDVRNQAKRRLLVLFTGRVPVIQATESEFRERQRNLHVLPYLVEEPHREEVWKSGKVILQDDSRQTWWRLYGEASGLGYEGLPEELSRTDLNDITAQPLLNYLVALSHSRGHLNFSKGLNLNDIYEDLLTAVHERAYEQKRQHAAIQGLTSDEFRRVLEEIALAAWHGNGRTTSVTDIEAHCKAAGLWRLLERFAEGAKTGVARVLTAFYFRQFGRTTSGDPTFEFTHKTFREFLTALRIVRALERIEEELGRRRRDLDSGWDDRDALRHWAELGGSSPMDSELLVFIQREVARRGEPSAQRWQGMLCGLIAAMLRDGMPMEFLAPRPSYQEEVRRAHNAEESLLATLNCCAQVSQEQSHIDWPDVEGELDRRVVAGAWFRRLQGQRSGPANALVFQCLSFLDLSETILDMQDLYKANLHRSNLRGASLQFANLIHANLSEADLQDAKLNEANLQGANLCRANLARAFIQRGDLSHARLEDANLEAALLHPGDLRWADLLGANLERANLEGADLRQSDLRGASLVDANLAEANLEKASLRGAKMEASARSKVAGSKSAGGKRESETDRA